MQASCELQHDVRDHDRTDIVRLSQAVVRIESALAALSYNALQQQSLATSAQQHQSVMIEALRVEVRDVVQMQRHSQDTINHLAQSQQEFIASVQDSVGTPSLQSLSSHSSSDNSICSFAGCMLNSASKGCSSGKSLRHMQVCPCCPSSTCRYLAIAEHMMLFQQAPRVTETDTCCWCGEPFDTVVSRDFRSRHRTKCHAAAILDLKNPSVKDQRINVLAATWSPLMGTPSKRDRIEKAEGGSSSPEDECIYSPPATPQALANAFTACELQTLTDDNFAFAAHTAFAALSDSADLDSDD